jgi:SlyX protein
MSDAKAGDAKTTDAKTLAERLDALEMRVAYQDDTLETLNETIAAQWKQIDALTRQLAELRERLQEAESSAAAPTNERPPHY